MAAQVLKSRLQHLFVLNNPTDIYCAPYYVPADSDRHWEFNCEQDDLVLAF